MNRAVEKYDVVVVGAGAGGVAAAVGAARTGARTLLIERYGFMGGAATNSQVLAYCGFYARGDTARQMVYGVGQELLQQLKSLGVDIQPIVSKSGYWIIMLDPEATKLAFDRLALQNNVEIALHSRVVSAQVCDSRIRSVTLADHAGLVTVEAGAFVDASGEATLSVLAGVPLTLEGGADAHLQPSSFPVRIGGVADGVEFDREIMAELIAQHNKTAEMPIPRADGGVVSRLPLTDQFWWMAIDLETDGITNRSLSAVETTARELAWRNLEVLRRHPGFERAYLVSTGPQIGVRETRRPLSGADVQESDVSEGRRYDDGIGRGSWPAEVHEAPGRARFVDIGGDGFFDIRAGALEAAQVDNLRLAGRVIGADSRAYGSVRVMGTAFASGHAAGVSAALASQAGAAEIGLLRKTLLEQGALV